MKKERAKRLKWFFDFIAADLKNLKVSEYQRFAAEAVYYLRESEVDTVGKWPGKGVQRYLDAVKDFSVEASSEFTPEKATELLGADLFSVQSELKQRILPILNQLESCRDVADDEILLRTPGPIGYSVDVSVINSEFKVKELYKGSTGDVFLIDFIRCLHSIPLSSFHKCPECNQWFVNVTKKEKVYCSQKCASRHIVRRKREDPAYRKKEKIAGAKRARKSYEKKVKADHPKAKIERRPIKYKV